MYQYQLILVSISVDIGINISWYWYQYQLMLVSISLILLSISFDIGININWYWYHGLWVNSSFGLWPQGIIVNYCIFLGRAVGRNHAGTCRITCQEWMKNVDVYSDAFQVFVLSEIEKLSFILNLFQNCGFSDSHHAHLFLSRRADTHLTRSETRLVTYFWAVLC